MTCPRCGLWHPPGTVTCPNCQQVLAAQQLVTPPPPARWHRLQPWCAIASVGIGFTAVLVNGAMLSPRLLASASDADRLAGYLALLICGSAAAGVGAVGLIVWSYQARSNVDALAVGVPKFGRGWSIGAYFIPVASVVLIPLVLADVARNSTLGRPTRGIVGLIWAWWMTYAAGSLAASAAQSAFVASGDFSADRSVVDNLVLPWWAVAANLPLVVAAALGIVAINKITRRQQDQADRGLRPAVPAVRASAELGSATISA